MLRVLLAVVIAVLLGIGYFAVVLNWSYSTGERAGWVQKLSKKGWLCKTWEGEMAMVSLPGTTPEKFTFTVWDDAVAERINKVLGKRVALHYEEKVGLPTSCFGDTRHFVTNVTVVEDIPLAPGIVVPTQPAPAPGTPPAGAPSSAPSPAPSPGTAPSPGASPAPSTPPTSGAAPATAPSSPPVAPAPSPTPAPPSTAAPAPTAPPAAPAPTQ